MIKYIYTIYNYILLIHIFISERVVDVVVMLRDLHMIHMFNGPEEIIQLKYV